jgi:hypothetical protein
MLSLLPPAQIDFEPYTLEINNVVPQKHRSLTAIPLQEGEIVILKDGNVAKDGYCAQLVKVLPTHVLVHWRITIKQVLPSERITFLKLFSLKHGV